MKRVLLILLVLLAGFYMSCSKSSSTGTTSGSAQIPEVIFWSSMTGALGEAQDKIIDGYNASQNKVKATAVFQGSYYDMTAKLQAAAAANDTPHMVQLEMARVKMFADFGILYDMTTLARNASLDVGQFFPGLMSSCDWGEGLVALPFNRSTPMFYYNKKMFAEVGLDPNVPPKNWTELADYARKLSIPNRRWGYEQPIDSWFYEAYIFQSRGSIFNADETDIGFNNETGTMPLALWKAWIAEGIMKTPPGQEYNSWEAARADFSAGIAGMIVTSSGDLQTLRNICDFEIGTCFLPGNLQFGVPTGGANISMIVGHDKDNEATIDFLKYATSPEPAAVWSMNTGYVPISPAAANTKIFQDYLAANPNARTVLDQLQYAGYRPNHQHYTQIHTELVMNEIQRCVERADITPEMCVQEISRQVRALLARR